MSLMLFLNTKPGFFRKVLNGYVVPAIRWITIAWDPPLDVARAHSGLEQLQRAAFIEASYGVGHKIALYIRARASHTLRS